MSKQILLCVETNKNSRTDYVYIESTIKKYYIDDRKIVYRPIFLDTKTKYKAKDKVREIRKKIKEFPGETVVIYFIDVDDYDVSFETQKLYNDIESYCKENAYEFVFFYRDVEDVYIGNQVSSSDKIRSAQMFKVKRGIDSVDESRLSSKTHRKHSSNILIVLDKYWNRK